MTGLSREEAGARIRESVEQFNDRLLRFEDESIAVVHDAFDVGADGVAVILLAGLEKRSAASVMDWSPIRVGISRLMGAVITQLATVLDQMVSDSSRIALASIAEELEWCEQSSPERLKGVTSTALESTAAQMNGLRAEVSSQVFGGLSDVFIGSYEEMRRQMKIAGVRRESPEDAVQRIVSDKPVGRPGRGGRGVWWEAESRTIRLYRAGSVTVANAVRETAMLGWNDAAT